MTDLIANQVRAAAEWLADRRTEPGTHLIPTMKAKFGLSAVDAAKACGLAQRVRMERACHEEQ